MTRLAVLTRVFAALGLWLLCAGARVSAADEPLPPLPARHFNDYVGVVEAKAAAELDQRLAQFERDTSNQLVVAVFKKLETQSSVADYTWRIAHAWKVGQKDKANGAVLFVFTDDRKMFIQVGYGLEGALPDAICKRIIDETLKPAFRRGDFTGGLRAGVDAMIAATKGEYKGTGQTQAERRRKSSGGDIPWIPFLFFAVLVIQAIVRALRGTVFGRSGPYQPTIWTSGGGFSAGGGGFDGGSSGGDSGGLSGGGGDFGGGGAGGDW